MKSILIGLTVSAFLFGRSERGSTMGAVSDPSGASVANAPISITNQATAWSRPAP
jgi:hypothetical protein